MDADRFRALARPGRIIPVFRERLADTLTPVSAFLRIRRGARAAFLLESVEGGERMGRYSFLGRDPHLVIEARGRQLRRIDGAGAREEEGDFFDAIRQEAASSEAVDVPNLPPFDGGGVGFIGYDAVRLIERIPDRHGPGADLPDASFGFYDEVLAFDHVRHRIQIIANVRIGEGGRSVESSWRDAQRRIDALEDLLAEPARERVHPRSSGETARESTFTREAFEEAVGQGKEAIRAGEIFQIVLSQRFRQPVAADPFTVYRALRALNPSPYLFHLEDHRNDGDRAILGSSPETLVRVRDRIASIRPIAGTRPRGATEEEDRRLEEELLRDEKELAEHMMLVDLGRNDIGRIARFGTVRLPRLKVVERYSHVMHIVTQVDGELRPEFSAVDALRAGFPAGTVSGAPKIRAMELIDELEPSRRGVYAGAVGYLDYRGNLDTAIAIRTLVLRDGVADVQAGAGIVADSVPSREYDETVHKANALFAAIRLAERGLA
ncbi:MAG: anthranilate synthase component I [Planctomycetes bacterium]|nr:anthranilate synthase component I [Planctomycetota bacterium]